jgi:hypothetical protein
MLMPDKLLNNLQSINLADLAVEAASMHERELVIIQRTQMSKGFRGDGEKTKKYKSKSYENRFKTGAYSLPNRDYFLTGDFYKDIFVKAESGKVFFGSMDSKSNMLEKEEDNQLFGLSGEYKEKEIEIIENDFVKLLENAITR